MKLSEIAMLPAATALHAACTVGLAMSLPVVVAQSVLFDLRDEIVTVLVARVRAAFDAAFDADTETETLEVAA